MNEEKAPASPPASVMQRLVQLLSRAERSLTRQLGRLLEDEGCTVEQWRTLVLLADGNGHSMSEIAEFALVPAPSVTRLIDRMVADNLVYRKADPQDGRRVLVRITPRGRSLQQRLAGRIEASQAALLAGADANDVAQLAALLNQLAERLR